MAIYTRKEQKKAAEIDTNKMAKNSPNWLFTPERSRRRLSRSTPKNRLKFPKLERSRRRLWRSTPKNRLKFPKLAIYTRKEQKKSADIDTNKMAKNSPNCLFTPERSRRRLLLKIPQIGYLHPKWAEKECGDRHQKMAENSPKAIYTRKKLQNAAEIDTKKWLKI